MGRLFDTLTSRLILVLLLSLGIFHLGSIYLYQAGMRYAASLVHEEQLAERLVSIKRSLGEQVPARREDAAHGLSTAALDVHWSEVSLVNDVSITTPELLAFRHKLLEALPGELTAEQIRLGYADEGVANSASSYNSHIMLASLQMADKSWVNFAITSMAPSGTHDHGTILSTSLMAVGIILVSLLVVRWFNRPLAKLADAAERLGSNIQALPLAVTGPKEVRQAATAFNNMQAALQQMMRERSLALAAISHDLRTPLTRIRLRAEFIGDTELRDRTERDVVEMQELIDSALDYLRDEQTSLIAQDIDLSVLLQEICAAFKEMGHHVSLSSFGVAPFRGQPLTLRRAFSNLIDNAIKYGQQADVSLKKEGSSFIITIADQGPGIPEHEHHNVLKPFYRLDASREAGPGGSGLGLSVADMAIKRHGGSLVFTNLPQGGLLQTISLPLPDKV